MKTKKELEKNKKQLIRFLNKITFYIHNDVGLDNKKVNNALRHIVKAIQILQD